MYTGLIKKKNEGFIETCYGWIKLDGKNSFKVMCTINTTFLFKGFDKPRRYPIIITSESTPLSLMKTDEARVIEVCKQTLIEKFNAIILAKRIYYEGVERTIERFMIDGEK